MKRICCISNFAPHYRSAIYKKIDAEFDCTFIFGEKPIGGSDILSFDLSELKHSKVVKNRILMNRFYWQEGVVPFIFRDYNTYIILGEPFCISTWIFLIFSKLYPKKSVFFWSHGWYGREGLFKRIFKRIFFKLGAGVLLYGNYAKELMVEDGFDPKKLFVIHNSLNYDLQLSLRNSISDTDTYKEHFKNENPNLVFVGRLTKIKSLNMILEALTTLKLDGHLFNLTLIGDGEQKSELINLTRKLGIEDQVWFHGSCYNERTNAILIYNADLCVSPGNVGLTAIHSLMFGCPVLTHNNFKMQMPEFEAIVPGKTGDFFEYKDTKSLAEKILSWFNSNRNRTQVRKECFNEIDGYWNPEYQINIIKNAIY